MNIDTGEAAESGKSFLERRGEIDGITYFNNATLKMRCSLDRSTDGSW
jgi:hypothetical protein